MRTVVIDRNHFSINTFFQHHGTAIGANVFAYQPMGWIHGHVAQMPGSTVIGHFQTKPVIRIKYYGIVRHAHNSLLNTRQLFQGFDTTQPHMVSRDVNTGGNIALAVTEACA